jgi:hypothetical protein
MKHWRARVVLPVRTTGEDGSIIDITPGEYALRECDGARYLLTSRTENAAGFSLWFTELLQCAYAGQVEILGMWP